MKTRAQTLAGRYFVAMSGPASQIAQFDEGTVADPVLFYGRSISRRTLVATVIAYMQRWPERTFSIRPGSVSVTCDQTAACTVTGVYDFNLRSAARHVLSSGAEKFDLRVDTASEPRIAAIRGTTIQHSTQRQD